MINLVLKFKRLQMKKFDVMVIGAGPAGSTAAKFCAKAGLKTAIIEKEKLPRSKICAGGIIPAALKFCNINIPDNIIERKCDSITLEYKRLSKTVKIQEPIYMVERSNFDMYLTEEAIKFGAILKENEKLSDFSYKDDHISISTTKDNYKTRLLIGADGYLSTVRKLLGISFNTKSSPIAVETIIPLINDKISERFDNNMIVSYIPGIMGYAWIFPKKNHLTAGIGTFLKSPLHIKDRLFTFLNEHGLNGYNSTKSWFIPPTYNQTATFSNGIILIGDAAGFVDAFTGEGIRYAMISGKLAAVTAENCFKKNDFSRDCLKEYNELCRKFVIHNLAYSKKISHYIYGHQWLTVPAAIKSKKLLERYANTLFGHGSYQNLVSWLKPRLPFILLRRFLPF